MAVTLSPIRHIKDWLTATHLQEESMVDTMSQLWGFHMRSTNRPSQKADPHGGYWDLM